MKRLENVVSEEGGGRRSGVCSRQLVYQAVETMNPHVPAAVIPKYFLPLPPSFAVPSTLNHLFFACLANSISLLVIKGAP